MLLLSLDALLEGPRIMKSVKDPEEIHTWVGIRMAATSLWLIGAKNRVRPWNDMTPPTVPPCVCLVL
jgi:hypothetical protein